MRALPHPDPGRAILAVLLALALWVSVQNELNPDRVGEPAISVPVEVKGIPPGLVIVGEVPSVRVRLRAPSDVWARLREGSFHAWADASRAGPGLTQLSVNVESLEPQVRSLEPVPPTVGVRFEEMRERQLPVKVDVIGNVPFGYSYGNVLVRPEQVTVAGPASLVDRVEAAVVELRMEGVTVNVNETRVPKLLDARGGEVRGARLTPATVAVEVEVKQQVAYKQVGVKPVVTGRVAPGYLLGRVDVEPAVVTVVGDPRAMAGIDFVETEPVDVGGATTGFSRRAALVVPSGVTLVQAQAAVVTIGINPLLVSQTVRMLPSVVGLDSDLEVVGRLPQIDVTVSGPSPIMSEMSPRDFRAVLDLAGLRAGRYSVRPRIVTPAGITVESVEPDSLVVVLQELAQPTSVPSVSPGPAPTAGPSPAAPTPASTPVPSR